MRLISHGLTPGHRLFGIRSLMTFGRLRGPLGCSVPYLRQTCSEASPKAISGRTSYLRVRLEFLRYPHLIPALFNGRGFGPPWPFTATSSWTRVGHPVSGPRYQNFALFRLGFPSAPRLKRLTIPDTVARRTVLQKVHGYTCRCTESSPAIRRTRFARSRSSRLSRSFELGLHRDRKALLAVPSFALRPDPVQRHNAPAVCGHGISGALSLPSRGSFHLSLTVLYSIGHQVVFSLTRWSSLVPTGFLVSRGTPDLACLRSHFAYGAFTLFGRLFQNLSAMFPLGVLRSLPRSACTPVWAPPRSLAATYGITFVFFSSAYLDVSVQQVSPCMTMDSSCSDRTLPGRVSPFRHLRITAHLRLPAAFRSLSRLSSAPGAKASVPRLGRLDLPHSR